MRSFGHSRPIRKDGQIIGEKQSPVRALTRGHLDGLYGPDRERQLIVSLDAGDLIGLKPKGTQRKVHVSVFDVYRFALQCIARRASLEKAVAAKSKKAERLAARRLATAERRLREQAKRDCEREAI